MTPAWDLQLFFALNSLAGRSPFFDGIIVFFASYLPFILILIFAAYLAFRKDFTRSQRELALGSAIIAGLVARFGIGSPIRYFFPRPRPFMTYHVHQLLTETTWSFPSAHALFFFAFSTVVFSYDRRLGYFMYAATVLMCMARIAAGIHYPSDIFAGAVLGVGVGWLVADRIKKPELTSR